MSQQLWHYQTFILALAGTHCHGCAAFMLSCCVVAMRRVALAVRCNAMRLASIKLHQESGVGSLDPEICTHDVRLERVDDASSHSFIPEGECDRDWNWTPSTRVGLVKDTGPRGDIG